MEFKFIPIEQLEMIARNVRRNSEQTGDKQRSVQQAAIARCLESVTKEARSGAFESV